MDDAVHENCDYHCGKKPNWSVVFNVCVAPQKKKTTVIHIFKSSDCVFLFVLPHQKKAKGEELFDQIMYHLDIVEKDYFGLRFMDSAQVPVRRRSLLLCSFACHAAGSILCQVAQKFCFVLFLQLMLKKMDSSTTLKHLDTYKSDQKYPAIH